MEIRQITPRYFVSPQITVEDVPAIVMLTKTFEALKVMCVQYWPVYFDIPEKYGDFVVTFNSEECYAHFKVRRKGRA